MEILECKPECRFTYWNAWTLVFQEKNQRQKQYKNDSVFCGMDLSRAILAGRQSKWTGSLFRKSGREKSQPSDKNHTILNLSNPISPPRRA